jgi:hypothetical protein
VLASSYLRQLVPGTTAAIFTIDNTRGVLVEQHAAGSAAARISGLTIDIGYRVSGWVAANWQPMINADAGLDLEKLAEDLRYVLAVPLVAENRMLGVLSIYGVEQFTDLQSRRVEMITPHLATALASTEVAVSPKSSRDLRVVARR